MYDFRADCSEKNEKSNLENDSRFLYRFLSDACESGVAKYDECIYFFLRLDSGIFYYP